MSSKEIAIKVDNVSKVYNVYENPKDRLKQIIKPNQKYYKEFKALQPLSFEVEKGSTVGILGRNGSGKSTLLQMVAGTLTPTTGNIEKNGRVVALLELGSGFNMDFTGRENAYLNGAMFGIAKEEMDKKYAQIEEFAGIGEYIDQPVKTYSSGMFARIAFAVAINMDPDILIVDETLSVGDIAFQAKCVSKMRKMKDAGLTLLFVSHSVDAIKSLCNRAILLEKGRLIDMGTSEAIVNKYLASIREDMNAENREEELESTEEVEAIAEEDTLQVEIDLTDTNQWVEQFTYGEGEVYFTKVEMLNAKKEKTLAFDFGEEAILRCHISAKARYENDNISFLIRDITGIDLFGTTMFDEKIGLLTIEKNEKRFVDFKFPIYLRAGSYSISAAVNSVTDKNYSDVYLYQQIDGAAAFEVLRDLNRPVHYKFHIPTTIDCKESE